MSSDLTPASIAAADQFLAGAAADLGKLVRFVHAHPGLDELSSVVATLTAEYDPRCLVILLVVAARRLGQLPAPPSE